MVSQRDTTFTKIFVGGLPYHTTDETLRIFFERFGDIEEAVVITDRATGKSRGYGFVTMANKEAAQEAIKDPNPVIDGRKANVNLAYLGAKPRTALNSLHNVPAANTVLHLGAYPTIQTYGLQPSIIYPTHTLLGSNYTPFTGAGGSTISPTAQNAHYTTAYDLAQFGAAQLTANDASAANAFQYGAASHGQLLGNSQTNQNALANAAAIAQLANANSYYAALASQAISSGTPSALAAFQQ